MLLAAASLVMTPPASPGMDDAALKEWLTGGLFELLIWKGFDIKETGVTDEQFHRVLMELYSEAEEKRPQLTPKTDEWNENRLTVEGVLACLPMCGDIPVKDFLLDYAVSEEKDSATRRIAVSSYLRVADANEARDALARFLTGGGGGVDKLSVYEHAREVYDKTPEEGVAKRRAILAALMVAAAHGEGKIGFVEVDRIIAMRSDAYRRSRERLALLEHHSLEPPTANLYTDADLGMALAEARKFRVHTSVNTNADLLKARDFSQAVVWRMSRRGAACSLFPARRPCLRRGAFLRRAQAHHGSAPAGAGRPVSAQLVQVSFPA